MSTQDKLPPLPKPLDWPDGEYTADDMRAYARAALAAQEAEPVWRMHPDGKRAISEAQYADAARQGGAAWTVAKEYTVKLYAAPPAREAVALTPHEQDRPDQGSRYVEGYGYVDAAALRAVERAVWQANNLREPT